MHETKVTEDRDGIVTNEHAEVVKRRAGLTAPNCPFRYFFVGFGLSVPIQP